MHREPEGVEGAQVTQLPSINLLVKGLNHHNAMSVPPVSSTPAPEPGPTLHQNLARK